MNHTSSKRVAALGQQLGHVDWVLSEDCVPALVRQPIPLGSSERHRRRSRAGARR